MRAPRGSHLRQEPTVRDPHPLELGIIIPTFKEAPNVAPLLAKLEAALQGVAWQAIFVDDDSPDGTAAAVKAIAAVDSRVICLHRIGRRGLAGAVVRGALATPPPFVAVIARHPGLAEDPAALPGAALRVPRPQRRRQQAR